MNCTEAVKGEKVISLTEHNFYNELFLLSTFLLNG